jgi:hypothetical protein
MDSVAKRKLDNKVLFRIERGEPATKHRKLTRTKHACHIERSYLDCPSLVKMCADDRRAEDEMCATLLS